MRLLDTFEILVEASDHHYHRSSITVMPVVYNSKTKEFYDYCADEELGKDEEMHMLPVAGLW